MFKFISLMMFMFAMVLGGNAYAVTLGEMKQALAVLSAVGVPDSAVVKANGASMGLSPIAMAGGIVETLDSEGHWILSAGSTGLVTEINFPAP